MAQLVDKYAFQPLVTLGGQNMARQDQVCQDKE